MKRKECRKLKKDVVWRLTPHCPYVVGERKPELFLPNLLAESVSALEKIINALTKRLETLKAREVIQHGTKEEN